MEQRKFPVHIAAASGLVYKDGRVLLVKSPRRGWEFPGGMVEQGETLTDGLRREIFEESGINAEPVRFVGVYQRLTQREAYGIYEGQMIPPVINFTFICRYVSGTETVSDESTEVGWFTEEEAREMVVYPTYDKKLADMLADDGRQHFCSFEQNDGMIGNFREEIL